MVRKHLLFFLIMKITTIVVTIMINNTAATTTPTIWAEDVDAFLPAVTYEKITF